jgi:large subunit ribosomal protein L23
MALFGSQKKTEAKKPRAKAQPKAEVVSPTKDVAVTEKTMTDISAILRRPRITEKASTSAERNVYVFEVAQSANKKTIAAAVRNLYNVIPVRVAVTAIPKKQKFIRGKWGVRGGGKKAYVYLKKGETIEFV